MKRNTAFQPLVLFEKCLHLLRIPGKDNDDAIPVIFHHLHNRVDCFRTIGITAIDQCIRLINIQYASLRLLKLVLYHAGCPPNILGNKILSSTLHKPPAADRRLLF